MKYRVIPGTDRRVSALGFGCMRLPVTGAQDSPIDRPRAISLIRSAIDRGMCYVDTAYGYHGGDSEYLVGEALADGYRGRVTLATKLPVWLVEKYEDMERLLDEQLDRLKTDHADVYLLHALSGARFAELQKLGVLDFLSEMVKKGKILYPGFSFHDGAEAFLQILNAYDWKICQVQMNLLDEFHQATLQGIRAAAAKGVGVVVMEPLRGGALTKTVPEEIKALYAGAKAVRTPADWAFRWLIDQPEVTVVLSGMSDEAQVDENLAIFDGAEAGCLSDDERQMLERVREAYERRVRVGCTGCRYCMPCPQGIRIPEIFKHYDEAGVFDDPDRFAKWYAREAVKADACLRCMACADACPQHFDVAIPDMLQRIHRETI